MILTVCSNADLLSVMVIVKKIMNLLQIIVPIGLVIFASIDIIKAVISNKQDEIYKKLHMIPQRLFAAIIIFFVPVIIDLLMGLIASNFEYASCFTNATDEYVQQSYEYNAYDAVAYAESSLKMYDYEKALLLTNKVKDDSIKIALKERLKVVLTAINEYNKNKVAEETNKAGTTIIVPGNNSGSSGTANPDSGNVNFVNANEITQKALSRLGTPYNLGGKKWSTGVDCSGFVYLVLSELGYDIHIENAAGYRDLGCGVSSIENARAGDLLIYGTRHIAIYLGEDTNGKMWRVHASGDNQCDGVKTATGCQVLKDTRVTSSLRDVDRANGGLVIRRVTGAC